MPGTISAAKSLVARSHAEQEPIQGDCAQKPASASYQVSGAFRDGGDLESSRGRLQFPNPSIPECCNIEQRSTGANFVNLHFRTNGSCRHTDALQPSAKHCRHDADNLFCPNIPRR
jgi:hypothetical protein